MIKTFYHKTERKTTRSNKNPNPEIWSEEMPEKWSETQAGEDNSGSEEIPTNEPQKKILTTDTKETKSNIPTTKELS